MRSISIFSDLICPLCYIGKRRMSLANWTIPTPGVAITMVAKSRVPGNSAEIFFDHGGSGVVAGFFYPGAGGVAHDHDRKITFGSQPHDREIHGVGAVMI